MPYHASTTDVDGYTPFPPERIREYQREGHWENKTFHEVLDRAGESAEDRPAVISPRGTTTYGELIENSERIAAYMAGELGLETDDRVVLHFTNRPEFLELLFACSRIGVWPVMLLPRHGDAETRHVLEFSEASAYIAPAELGTAATIDDLSDQFDHLHHCITVTDDEVPDGWTDYSDLVSRDWTEIHGDALAVDVNPNNPAFLLLSGGTTGMPKGIPRTHNDYVFQWRRLAEEIGIEEDWNNLPCVPIGHNAAVVGVIGPAIYAGATVMLEPRLKPEPLMSRIQEDGVQYAFAVPTQLVDMLEHEDDYDLSCLDAILSGGQKVRPKTVRRFVDNWNVGFLNVFGMAEGPFIVTRPDDSIEVQANTVGRPLASGDEFRIVDETRNEEVPDGTPGELAGRGPGVFRGYFRNPEENEQNFDEDCWFYTEDILSRDEDGNYRVHGRLKDTIIRGGENIYAPGVEDEIIEHPDIENVTLIGMPDERLGERPCAYVELTDGADTMTLDELTSFLEERGLAVFKLPERLEVVEELPRTEVDKIDKVSLKDDITSKLQAEGRLPEDY